jgi:hypothetical protein
MEPRIQYATTADGVSIAFWTLGPRQVVVVPHHRHTCAERALPGSTRG